MHEKMLLVGHSIPILHCKLPLHGVVREERHWDSSATGSVATWTFPYPSALVAVNITDAYAGFQQRLQYPHAADSVRLAVRCEGACGLIRRSRRAHSSGIRPLDSTPTARCITEDVEVLPEGYDILTLFY